MPSLEDTVAEIRYHHRTRACAMDQRKRADLSLGAFLRTQLGWSKGLPEAERKAIAKVAADLIKTGKSLLAGKVDAVADPVFDEWADVIMASLYARKPFDDVEAKAAKEMTRLAKTLPVWPWAEAIKGFGAVSLAVIVAETGLVSCDKNGPPENGNYPNPAKLNKRMGVAVIDGVRQGGLRKNAAKEDWIRHGYSGERRSKLWVIGDVVKKSANDYRTLYLERKAIEYEKAVSEGLIPATTSPDTLKRWAALGLRLERVSKLDSETHRGAGHMERRAQRYIEKRLLRDLWRAWRAAEARVIATAGVPPADLSDAAE